MQLDHRYPRGGKQDGTVIKELSTYRFIYRYFGFRMIIDDNVCDNVCEIGTCHIHTILA